MLEEEIMSVALWELVGLVPVVYSLSGQSNCQSLLL